MANKKVSQLTSKPSVLTTDLFPIADPSTGQLYKTTISDLGTAIGSGVSSVNGLVGAVVLDTDDIQELVSPTNKWFTDTRARAALSASSPLTYNSGTGIFGIQVANGSQNGYLSSADWTTFNAKANDSLVVHLAGTETITGLKTITNNLIVRPLTGYNAYFQHSAGAMRINFLDDALTTNVSAAFRAADYSFQNGSVVTFTIASSGAASFTSSVTANSFIKSGGTSSQFLKADGSVDSNSYLTTGTASSTYVPYTGATGAVDLGANNLTSKNVIINGAASTFRQLNFYTSGSPRWSIYASNLAETGSNAGSDLVITKTNDDGVTTSPVFTISRATGNSQVNYSFSITTLNTAGIVTNTSAGLLGTSTGTGFIKMSSGVVSYDNSTYLTTSSASSTYLPLSGGTLTGALSGTSATFSGTTNVNNNLIQTSTTDQNIYHIINRVNGTPIYDAAIVLRTNGANNWGIGLLGNTLGSTTDFAIRNFNTNTSSLRINYSNDSSTFSSSSYNVTNFNSTYGQANINIQNNGTTFAVFGSGNSSTSSASASDVGIGTAGLNNAIVFATGTGYSERMRIASGGNILVGTTTDNGIKFQVSGDIYSTGYHYFKNTASTNNFAIYGSTNILFYNSAVGNIANINATTGIYVATSDRNKKKDFEDSIIGLNEVMQLKPTLYRMKTESEDSEKQLGFIAQEVQGIIPSAYQESGDFIGLNFNPIVAALTKAVQEQQVQIQELKAELDTLKNK